MTLELEDEEFEELVSRALDRIPERFVSVLENCVIAVEDEPPPGQHLLGLYCGVPVTDRTGYYAGVTPDVITIYQKPLERMCHDLEELEYQVYRTVVHEIGHYFGLDDDELHDLGWG